MWMMGYNDGGELNLHDSFNGTSRRLRPLIPRSLPNSNSHNNNTTPTSNPPCFFAQYHHLASLGEQNKREFNNSPQVVVSSRWNPTPEQLRALEELYRRGTRTPSAEQIQHITAQLRRYGKIEGKNVFYWFQNHKARERQKRRRQMESATPSPPADELEMSERNKELGASRTVYEVEQTKNWAPSSSCSTTLAEESHVSIQRAAANNHNNKVAGSSAILQAASECVRTDGWDPLGEGELHNRRINNNMNFVERNATWQMMQLSCPPPLTHLINTPISTTTDTTMTNPNNNNISTNINTSRTTASLISSTMDQRLIKTTNTATSTHHDHLSVFITPGYRSDQNGLINSSHLLLNSCVSSHIDQDHDHDHDHQDYSNICSAISEESQTLQLFPLRSSNEALLGEKETHEISVSAMNTPCQFFEFLPLKN